MKIGGNMKGYRLNKDIEYVKKIMQGIENFLINFPIFSFPNMFSSLSIFSSLSYIFYNQLIYFI